jgi:hypothetical protein
MWGNRVEKTRSTPFRSVIGEIDRTPSGRVILRIGREHESGWEQTEHVVMLRNETADFVRQVTDVLNPRSTKDRLTLRFDQQSAIALLDRLSDAPVTESTTWVDTRLAEFVNPDQP